MLAVSLPLVTLAALAGEKVYRAGEDGVTPPRIRQQIGPKYTEEARNAHIRGTVVLAIEITPQGHAENIKVVKSLDPGLDRNAIEAVRQWTFEPGTRNGAPVRVGAQVEVSFQLEYAFLPLGDPLPPRDPRRA